MHLEQIKEHCPRGWQYRQLGEVCKVSNNLRLPLSVEERKDVQGIYPYYGPTKILDYINEYRVEGKFTLISEDGDHFLKYNEVPMTLLVNGKFNVNNHAHLVQGANGCLTEWIFFFYNHTSLETYITRQGVGRYKLTKDALLKLPILVPSLKEQEKIIEIFFQWDAAIKTIENLITAKTELKKGLMQQLLKGKKRFQEFARQEWREVRLGEVFCERCETLAEYLRKLRDDGKEEVTLELLSITAKNGVVQRDTLDKRDTSNEDKSKYLRICPGDIGYNTMRMWQGVSGLSELEGIVSPAYTICTPTDAIDGKFASYLFKHTPLVHLFWRYSQGLVDDTLNLKFHHFAQIKVLLPPIKEQRRIASILETCDKEIELLVEQRAALKAQKRGLMQQLLTGKKRVKVDEELLNKATFDRRYGSKHA